MRRESREHRLRTERIAVSGAREDRRSCHFGHSVGNAARRRRIIRPEPVERCKVLGAVRRRPGQPHNLVRVLARDDGLVGRVFDVSEVGLLRPEARLLPRVRAAVERPAIDHIGRLLAEHGLRFEIGHVLDGIVAQRLNLRDVIRKPLDGSLSALLRVVVPRLRHLGAERSRRIARAVFVEHVLDEIGLLTKPLAEPARGHRPILNGGFQATERDARQIGLRRL